MESHLLQVTHKGEQLELKVRHGLGLQTIERQCSWLEFDCRKADCGICIVRILSGADQLSAPTAAEADFLKAMQARPDERLACQCRVFGPVALEIDDYT